MDGLMIDSEPLWWSVERSVAATFDKTWTDEMAHRCIGTGLPNTVLTMQTLLGIELGVDEGVQRLVEAFIAQLGALELKPGCRELLDAAKARGLALAVASSSTLRLIEAVLERFAFASRFDAVVSGESVERCKPAPDIFVRAAALLGIEASDCVVLEDSRAGVEAARAARIPVIAVPERDHQSFDALTAHVAADLHEARAMLGL
jgi:HAD superfamily hydrolase (TIGR01509 family)